MAAIREALDQWDVVSQSKKQGLDRTQSLVARIDDLRATLRHITHLAHHGFDDAWNREDALLVLVTAAALLAREGM